MLSVVDSSSELLVIRHLVSNTYFTELGSGAATKSSASTERHLVKSTTARAAQVDEVPQRREQSSFANALDTAQGNQAPPCRFARDQKLTSQSKFENVWITNLQHWYTTGSWINWINVQFVDFTHQQAVDSTLTGGASTLASTSCAKGPPPNQLDSVESNGHPICLHPSNPIRGILICPSYMGY